MFKSVDEIAASLKEHETKVSMAQASIRFDIYKFIEIYNFK